MLKRSNVQQSFRVGEQSERSEDKLFDYKESTRPDRASGRSGPPQRSAAVRLLA